MEASLTDHPHRAEVTRLLRTELPGKNLYRVAEGYGITVRKDGRLNKGWVGQTIERAAGLSCGTLPVPDGADFELKTTTIVFQKGLWKPRETIKITQLNPQKILEETFETSALWRKLESLILVGIYHESEHYCRVEKVCEVALAEAALIDEIRAFWNEVRLSLTLGEIALYTSAGTSTGLIQLRPTGTVQSYSRCPVTGEPFRSQAFYATKRLVERLFAL